MPLLRLLDTPHWDDGSAGPRVELPATLPLWLIAYLVLRDGWVERTQLAAVFWPDRADEEAQHNLRVNLHRVKQTLANRGRLHAERSRVRLEVENDVAVLRASLTANDVTGAFDGLRRPLLDTAWPHGFPALQAWLEMERAALTQAWRASMLAARDAGRLDARQSAGLAQQLLVLDPLDETAAAWRLETHLADGTPADGLRWYRSFAQRLRETLDVEPSRPLQALQQRLLALADAALPRPASGSHERFVGRAIELAQLRAMLAQPRTRWLSVVGPGGVGKTRLARELCAAGDTWVALADAGGAAQIGTRLAAALGLALPAAGDATEAALRALAAGRCRRLWFDNAEQIDGVAAWFDRIVAELPALQIVITSREPLGGTAESSYTLDGLATPPADTRDATSARAADAVAFFELRALAADPDFRLDAQLDGVLALLDRIGGWPLAIELAAAWMRAASAAEIAAELAASIDALASEYMPEDARHVSMRASIEWSWQRLMPAQRSTLAALSVFRGGFTRAAAASVAEAGAPTLAQLVARSLLRVAGGGRYELHPLLALFAAEQLAAGPQAAQAARTRHAEHFLERLAQLGAPAPEAAAQAVEADFENFVQAWRTGVECDDARRLAAAAPAWEEFCQTRGRVAEVLPLLDAALARFDQVEGPDLRQLLGAEAALRYMGGDLVRAEAAARRAWRMRRLGGAADSTLGVLNTLALVLYRRGQRRQAERFAALGLERSRRARNLPAQAGFAGSCGMIARARGDYERSQAMYAESAALFRRLGHHTGLAQTLMNLGVMHHARHDWPAAQATLEEAVRVADLHGVRATLAYALGALAWTHVGSNQPEAALHFAERALADRGAEPTAIASAHAAAARACIELDRLPCAAAHLASAAGLALATASQVQLLIIIAAHARRLLRLRRADEAAARLEFVAAHPACGAAEREAARALVAGLGLDAERVALARRGATQLTLTRLTDEVRAAAEEAVTLH